MDEKLLKVRDVQEHLNCSRAYAYRLLDQRQLPAVRINGLLRVREADLKQFVQEHLDT
jgi:excisionase family DNA binding protein